MAPETYWTSSRSAATASVYRARLEDWSELMMAARAGDGTAYRRLLLEIREWLRRYYSRRLPWSMAEDATQDALIAVDRKKHTYDQSRPFGPWLAAIARYKWIDRIRAMKTQPPTDVDDELMADSAAVSTSAELLDRLLGTLNDAQADVIRLVKIQGFSVEEAATRTGQSVSLVKVNIHRGLARLTAIAREAPAGS